MWGTWSGYHAPRNNSVWVDTASSSNPMQWKQKVDRRSGKVSWTRISSTSTRTSTTRRAPEPVDHAAFALQREPYVPELSSRSSQVQNPPSWTRQIHGGGRVRWVRAAEETKLAQNSEMSPLQARLLVATITGLPIEEVPASKVPNHLLPSLIRLMRERHRWPSSLDNRSTMHSKDFGSTAWRGR